MVRDHEEHDWSFVQLFESSLPKLWEHAPTGVSNVNHTVAGANVLAGHPDFDRDGTRKRMLEIGPSMQLSL